ncbi:MAG: DNA mismatch repair endonuclease MutL [Armatimonadetes bacterium]|nr:DNA mismatch repair endonuclease MutL [Armatimonadota bacterium]
MGRIVVLPPDVASQIAAGEVVERPASVVKELIENSLDAGATKIIVRIEDGGKRLIRVTDDGCGMDSEDAVLAFQRHATSKIRDANDLWRITTMGFRGEALPSIAAVAHVELVTRTPNSEQGTKVVIEGGILQSVEPIGCPQGTTVTVTKLFFNTPARLKFLKASSTEFAHIAEIVSRYILAFPEVSFTLFHGEREILHHVTTGDQKNALAEVIGRELAHQLLPVYYHEPPYTIRGFISLATISKPTRSHQWFFVNNRFVRNKTLASAISHAYHGFIPEGRHPVVILFVDLPSELVDVNVHPAKIEVRFRKESEVQSVVVRAIKEALIAGQVVPVASLPLKSQTVETMETLTLKPPESLQPKDKDLQRELADFRTLLRLRFGRAEQTTSTQAEETATQPVQTTVEPAQTSQQTPKSESLATIDIQPSSQTVQQIPKGESETMIGAQTLSQTAQTIPTKESAAKVSAQPSSQTAIRQALSTQPKVSTSIPRPSSLTPIKQIAATYILAENDQGDLFIISQHRAHERILFERLLKRAELGEVLRQGLVVPFTLNLGQAQSAFVESNLSVLKRIGFELEPFGRNTFLVRTVPAAVAQYDCERLLYDLIDELTAGEMPTKGELFHELLSVIACKASVKAGEILSQEEMQKLLDDLLELDNPSLCPHGQPIIIALTKSELDKRFER